MQTPAHGATKPPHARRFAVTGCHLAAIVLERLQWWEPRATIVRAGVRWVAKKRADLMDETGLTEKQLRTSLDKLRDRDIVATERRRFGGETILHLRITPRGSFALANAGFKGRAAQEGGTEVASGGNLELAQEGDSYEQGETNKGIQQEEGNSFGVAANPDFSEKAPEETKTVKEPRKPRVNPKAPSAEKPGPRNSAEVMEMLKAGKKPAPKPGKPVPLGEVWQAAMVEAFPGEFHPSLTI